jgi:hypothetical protein
MKILFLAGGMFLLLSLRGAAQNWTSYLDGSSFPAFPWQPDSNEGSTLIVPIDATNNALRMDSSNPSGSGNNEWYVGPIVVNELVGASRFRLLDFSAFGKENILSVTVGGAQPTAPSITLVDGRFKVWSYTTDLEILDLGPAFANQFHTAYILARNDGTAKVWWDGVFVVDGGVPITPSFDAYVEFGSGTYWQTTAATTIDFDWVGYGDGSTMIPEPSNALLIGMTLLGPAGWAAMRRRARLPRDSELAKLTR